MKVRAATIADKPAWLALRRRLTPALADQAHERDWTRMMEQRGRRETLVCVDDQGAMLGMIEVSRRVDAEDIATGPVGWVESLHVEPGEHREESARLLTDAAGRWARMRGCRVLASDTSVDNQWEQKLHLGLGFEEVARKVIYRRALESAPMPSAVARDDAAIARPLAIVAPDEAYHDGDDADVDERPAWRPRVLRAGAVVLGLLCLYFTDLFSGSVVRGVLLPMADVAFIVYVLVLFVDMKYRRRTDSGERHLELLHGSNDGE